jgi:hypothetical protein
MERLRESEPDEPGRAALERALRVLDGVAVARAATPAVPATAPAPGAVEPASTAPQAEPPAGDERTETEGEVVPAEPEPVVAGPRAALDRDLPADVDVDALSRSADEAIDGGDVPVALDRLLDLAAAHRRIGNAEAAIDACYLGLSLDPDSVDLHLALVELYGDRDWGALAGETLDLLERLATLDGDETVAARVAAARTGPG